MDTLERHFRSCYDPEVAHSIEHEPSLCELLFDFAPQGMTIEQMDGFELTYENMCIPADLKDLSQYITAKQRDPEQLRVGQIWVVSVREDSQIKDDTCPICLALVTNPHEERTVVAMVSHLTLDCDRTERDLSIKHPHAELTIETWNTFTIENSQLIALYEDLSAEDMALVHGMFRDPKIALFDPRYTDRSGSSIEDEDDDRLQLHQAEIERARNF